MIELSARLLALLAIQQGAEYLAERTKIDRIWKTRSWFAALNALRILIAVGTLISPTPAGLAALLFIHILTLVKFRGPYNGGSDAMNLLLLWTTPLALATEGKTRTIVLWYITFHVSLSYVRAGLAKMRQPGWRKGDAIKEFIDSEPYQALKLPVPKLASYAVMIFEVTFPLGLINPQVAAVYLTLGALFHIANAYVFGLNRFVLAWLAAYPVYFFCAR